MAIKRPNPTALLKASWYLRQYNSGEGDGLSADLIAVADWIDQTEAQRRLAQQARGELPKDRKLGDNVIGLRRVVPLSEFA